VRADAAWKETTHDQIKEPLRFVLQEKVPLDKSGPTRQAVVPGLPLFILLARGLAVLATRMSSSRFKANTTVYNR